MEQLDTLLQLIAHLQNDRNNIHGRRLLLEYARTSSGARLALLFRLDEEQQQLHLVARTGRRPQTVSGQPVSAHISLHGRFGTALETPGLLSTPDLFADEQGLPEERSWAWPGGLVVVCTAGQHGMLVLCFAPQKSATPSTTSMQSLTFDEGAIRICASLLSGYLSNTGHSYARRKSRQVASSTTDAHQPATGQYPIPSSPQLEAIIDRERERIARDIHDGPAQQIAAVLHSLEYIQRILLKRPQDARREIGRARQNLYEGLQDLRQCITTLIPSQLQHQSLSDALQAFKQDDGHLHIAIEVSNLSLVPLALEAPIYRFVQEALNNVRKHAYAQRAVVRVQLLPGLLLVEVSDDGKGFDSKTFLNRGGLHTDTDRQIGLQAMRDRVREAGGAWEIHNAPGTGTTVRARFPVVMPTGPAMPTTLVTSLTNRERDVLRLVIDGLTNPAIAEQLSVSTETVKSHVHHIMQKMNAKDRTHAAVLATKQHWV
jgi:signal transduction histidine kinase/DNA-binding CsgD family transcriptional regulator